MSDSQERTQLTGGGGSGKMSGEFSAGDVIGGTYQVLRWIGAGGMGNVYCVRHTIMQTEYALKTLSADKVTEVAWRRFQNEAQAIARMSHPNIVGIYNLGLHDARLPYYVMDLLKGQTLLDVLRQQGPLETNLALSLFIELCSGFGYAHKKGIVHRDIKPPNIVLLDTPEQSCRVKIVDFGIAKLSGIKDPSNQYLTNAGEVCGSPYYMSPEQTEGQHIDARSDIYSLGCTLFEILTGAPPLRGRSAVDTMLLHQTAAAPTLKAASGGKEFPEMLEQVIATLLAKAPMDRYQTMELVSQDLSTILAGEQAAISPFSAQPHKQLRPADGTDQTSGLSAVRAIPEQNLPHRRRYEAEGGDEDDQGSGQSRSPLVLIAGCLVGLCLTLGAAGLWWHNHTDATIATNRQKTGALLVDLVQENHDVLSLTDKELALDDEHKPPPAASLKDTKPFSHTEMLEGKPLRIFDFPEDIIIGRIRGREQHIASLATGRMCFSLEQITFTPDSVLIAYPQYLSRFRPGDIFCLKLVDRSASDKLFKYVFNIPGVEKLQLSNCPNLTAKSFPYIEQMPCLKALECDSNSLTASDLAHLARLTKLPCLSFCDQDDSDGFLNLIKDSSALETLQLVNSKVSHQGFEYISAIPNLSSINLGRARFASSDLQALAKMRNLKALFITNHKIDPDLLSSLKTIKSLKQLTISQQAAAPLSDDRIGSMLPGVKIVFEAQLD